MSKEIDELGKTYGRLTVVERVPSAAGRGAVWRARCKCGRERAVLGTLLRASLVTSCGCALARGASRRESKEQRDPVLLVMQERDELRRLVESLKAQLKKAAT